MKKVVALLLVLMLAVGCCGCTEKEQAETNPEGDDHALLIAESLWNAEDTLLAGLKADGDRLFMVCNNQKTEENTIYSCDSTFENCAVVAGDLEKADQHTTLFHTLEAHEGTLYLMQNSEDAGRVLLCFDEEGNQKGSIPLETPKKIWAADVLDNIFVRDGKIILVSSVGIQVCDAEGNTLYEITSSAKNPFYISAACVSEDGHIFYVSNEEEPALCCVSLADGNVMWEKSYSVSAQVRNLAFSEEEQRLYVHLDHALESYSVDGERHNEIIDLREYNVVQDENVDFYKSISCLYVKNRNELYYGYSSMENVRCEIVHLRSASETEQKEHETAEKEERRNLRIFLPYNDRRVSDLLYSFGEEHHVNVIPEYYADTFVDFNVADYLQVVSMRILSGDCGWDIMSTELIPFQQYAAQGYFAELYELAPELHDDSIYYTNILKACEQDGGLYYLPMCIEFFSLTSNQNQSTFPASLEELYAACEQAGTALEDDKDWIFQILFRAGYSGFCSTTPGEVSFSREEYMRWAELAKQFYTGDFYGDGESARFALHSELSFWTENGIPADGTMGLLPSADQKHHFTLCKGCAIMSDSSEKELAAELLCYLEENYRYFYSIRRDYTELVLDQMRAESAYNVSEDREAEIERYGTVLTSIYESFDSLDAIETNIYNVLWEQSYAYCKGEITLEAAANAAENAIMLYKQELGE